MFLASSTALGLMWIANQNQRRAQASDEKEESESAAQPLDVSKEDIKEVESVPVVDEEGKEWVVVEKEPIVEDENDEKPPVVEDEKVQEEEEEPSVYIKVETAEAITELLEKIENRVIFMKHGVEKPGHLEAVELFGQNFKDM